MNIAQVSLKFLLTVILLSTITIAQEPKKQTEDWSQAAIGGPSGTRNLAADLAKAHVGQRLFGPSADWLKADTILTHLLDGKKDPFTSTLIYNYGKAFDSICALPATTQKTGAAKVKIENNIAFITPGTTTPILESFDKIKAIIIDLRNDIPGSDIKSAAGLAFASDVVIGTRKVRIFQGFPSQNDDWSHYEWKFGTIKLSITGRATANRPLYFLTGKKLTPEAATIVGGLCLAHKAKIIGHKIHTAVAESTWTGIGEHGLLWRSSFLQFNKKPWPDIIPANSVTFTKKISLKQLREIKQTTLPKLVKRSRLKKFNRAAGKPKAVNSKGSMRAGLIVAYGTLDYFFPFFDIVGRGIDKALITGLSSISKNPSGNRQTMTRILERFMASIQDGHGFVADEHSENFPDGLLMIQIQEVHGLPVVRTSEHKEIKPGDTILAIDGKLSSKWYADAMAYVSSATHNYQFVLATGRLIEVEGTRRLTLKNPTGKERTVQVKPISYENIKEIPTNGTSKKSGWLKDLKARNIYYVNMSAAVTSEKEAANIMAKFKQISARAAGMILDMRDYPDLDIYEFARLFHRKAFTAPRFGHPTWTGPSNFEIIDEIWPFEPGEHVFTGPVVLLVSAGSVSAAECFAQMIVSEKNVTVIGQSSAGTNGSITWVWLPGKFKISFTGMRLRNADGSEFHGIGIKPDIEIIPTPTDFANGKDPELLAAIHFLQKKK